MMYGFGDTDNPLPETTDLVEDMTVDYITNFVSAARPVCPVCEGNTRTRVPRSFVKKMS